MADEKKGSVEAPQPKPEQPAKVEAVKVDKGGGEGGAQVRSRPKKKFSTCACIMKYGLFLMNVIVLAVGIVLVAIGTNVWKDSDKYTGVTGGATQVGTMAVTIIGGIIIGIAILGAAGAFFRIKCFLVIYCILLCIIFLLVLIAGVAIIIFQHNSGPVSGHMQTTMVAYDNQKVHKVWDTLQTDYKCCGINNGKGVSEWQSSYAKFVKKYIGESWRDLPGIKNVPGIQDVTDEEVKGILAKVNNSTSESSNSTTKFPPWNGHNSLPGNNVTQPSKKEQTLIALENLLRESPQARSALEKYFNPPVPITCCKNSTALEYSKHHEAGGLVTTQKSSRSGGAEPAELPASSSIDDVPPEICDKNVTEHIWQNGCLDEIMNFISIIGKVALGLCALLLLGIIMGICVIKQSKK